MYYVFPIKVFMTMRFDLWVVKERIVFKIKTLPSVVLKQGFTSKTSWPGQDSNLYDELSYIPLRE